MYDRNDPTQRAALLAEFTNDPTGKGYAAAAATGSDSAILDLFNGKTETVEKPKISSAEVRSAVTYEAYNDITADKQEWLRWITGTNGFNEENLVVTDDLKLQLTGNGVPADSFWAVSNRDEMSAAIGALINVPGSRPEVLFGYGTTISAQDWYDIRDNG